MTQRREALQMQQGEQQKLFRQTALDQVSATTGLDAYIKAVRPSTWLVAVAAVIAFILTEEPPLSFAMYAARTKPPYPEPCPDLSLQVLFIVILPVTICTAPL